MPMNKQLPWFVAGAVVIGVAGVAVGRWSAPATPEPKLADEVSERSGAEIALSAQQIQANGIEVAAATRRELAAELLAQGVVEAAPNAEAVLAARADGTIVQLGVRLGDPVRAGETLALIQSREAAGIVADQGKASAQLEAARAKLAREKRLFDVGVTARQDLESARADAAVAEAEAARASQAVAAARVSRGGTLAVVSPVSGQVSAAPAQLGAFVAAGADLFRVIDPRRLDIRAAVASADAARVSPGDAVRILVEGREIAGRVRSITPSLDTGTQSGTAVITPVADPLLRPGAAVQVRIAARRTAGAALVTVPDDAVQRIGDRDVVFVRTASGFRVQPVVVGVRSSGLATILSGLSADARVAGRNAFLLKGQLQKPSNEEGAE